MILGETTFGEFGSYTMCPKNTYMYSMNMKYETPCGACDDTAANGFQIYCRDLNNKNEWQKEVENVGTWGEYKGKREVEPNEFICGGSAKSLKTGTSDEQGITGFIMTTCTLLKV